MNRLVSAFGLLLIVLGVALGSVQLGAFDQVVAERDASVSVAEEDEAYLSIQDGYGGRTVRNYLCIFICFSYDRPRTVATLENRYITDYSTLNVEVDTVGGASDDTLEVSQAPTTLSEGEARNVVVSCSGTTTADGTGDVTLLVDVSEPVYIHQKTTIQDVSYDCAAGY
ncbi:hypothetical protein NP511_01070 [Natrinema thermotolerans]|uniref:Uncharacterized protein n=1 Tax=Natrinema thermotolerans TaxID=121872 RepID=A0AAF0PA00_9EURY|nr:hypothetical protein [Natrinema thermotolerans]QCC60569.1 hypothetical protein DVR14_18780 [Natrinema thermotolerans]QCC61457.1 hypothetical protein DVR14_22915 [Natrinema thermotolerans]WMT07611.1 hypothetical protein NP511_19785 [Natrinema thermotolerans]WMT08243.1 hypothetical protein NP511_01070 [Natrinema thermotolerans]